MFESTLLSHTHTHTHITTATPIHTMSPQLKLSSGTDLKKLMSLKIPHFTFNEKATCQIKNSLKDCQMF